MNRRRFVKLSTMAALANPIKGMVSSKSKKHSNRSKGHIAVIGAGAFGGWTAFPRYRRCNIGIGTIVASGLGDGRAGFVPPVAAGWHEESSKPHPSSLLRRLREVF